MLRSMTTFARADVSGDGWRLGMELKSVNNRYCDIHIRMPRWMNGIEESIKQQIKGVLQRGRIDFFIDYTGEGGCRPVFEPDIELGRAYVAAAGELADALGLSPEIDLEALLRSVKDIIVTREERDDSDAIWKRLEPHIATLLDQALEMAMAEGKRLEEDMVHRLASIEELLLKTGELAESNLEASVVKLKERLQKYLDSYPVDENRIAQEVVILTDKLDITEEQVRAASHVKQFREILKEDGPSGRKLDFLLQELFREVNTMASKSSNDRISQFVVEIKSELEKIREQVQNIV